MKIKNIKELKEIVKYIKIKYNYNFKYIYNNNINK